MTENEIPQSPIDNEIGDVENLPAVSETQQAPQPMVQQDIDYAGSVDRAVARQNIRNQIVKKILVTKEDYNVIPGCGNKPTLLKPGAEKIVDAFQLYPEFNELDKIIDHEKGFYFVRYECRLLLRGSNIVVATGNGLCNTAESKYRNRRGFDMWNTIDKMAQKRALIAAVLYLGFSRNFTQDIEDNPDIYSNANASYQRPPAQQKPPTRYKSVIQIQSDVNKIQSNDELTAYYKEFARHEKEFTENERDTIITTCKNRKAIINHNIGVNDGKPSRSF